MGLLPLLAVLLPTALHKVRPAPASFAAVEKKVWGRKRHVLVDAQGLLLRVHVLVEEQDRDSGLDLLVGADREYPRIKQLWADAGYRGGFEDWVETTLGWRVTIVSRAPEQEGFVVQARRWIVERTFAHLGRYRR